MCRHDTYTETSTQKEQKQKAIGRTNSRLLQHSAGHGLATGHHGRTELRQSRRTYRPSLPGLGLPQVVMGGQNGDRAVPLTARHSPGLRPTLCLFVKFSATVIFECSFHVSSPSTHTAKLVRGRFRRFTIGSRFTCNEVYGS